MKTLWKEGNVGSSSTTHRAVRFVALWLIVALACIWAIYSGIRVYNTISTRAKIASLGAEWKVARGGLFEVAVPSWFRDENMDELTPYLYEVGPLVLILDDSQVTDNSVWNLWKLKNLKALSTRRTQVSEDAVAGLGHYLPDLRWETDTSDTWHKWNDEY
jgi:hypothetical protein